MNKILSIVLYDSDKEYIESFSEYIKCNYRKQIIFNFFTDFISLAEYCESEKDTIDLIIIAEYLFCDIDTNNIIKRYSNKIVILGDEKDITHLDDFICIYRFQRTDLLISNVMDICAERLTYKGTSHTYSRRVTTDKIGFFSPVGRCGKTKITIELAKRLAHEGKKVLLINLEEFSVLDMYLGSNSDSNISDLLFYYLSGAGCFEIKSDVIIKSYQGFDYISPVKCVEDLRKIEYEVWISFIVALVNSKGYEVVIVEITNMVNDYFKLLDSMDIIFSIYLDNELSRYKMKNYREFINISDYKGLNDKISEISVKEGEEDEYQVINILMDKVRRYQDNTRNQIKGD